MELELVLKKELLQSGCELAPEDATQRGDGQEESSRGGAYLGLATGILGIVSLTGLSLTIIMKALFATVWILVVGYRLYRLARE